MPTIPTVATHSHYFLEPFDHPSLSPAGSAQYEPWHMLPRKLGSNSNAVLLVNEQRYIIQVVATVMASVSITAAIVALYWFSLMRRNYRRDLILLLVMSDLFKNVCYILFSGVSFTQGPVQSGDTFCQASGYLLQTGLEACDFAVFFISLHMALQIFPFPNTILGYDGLYNVRYWVYAIWFFLPNITASLAFINDDGAYQVQGAWCWLPVRPFWYRLALAWIPRYLITLIILSFAIMIYVRVGAETRLFRGPMLDSSSRNSSTANRRSTLERSDTGADSVASVPTMRTIEQRQASLLSNLEKSDPSMFNASSVRDSRRLSLPTWRSPFEGENFPADRYGSQSVTTSRRGSRQVTFDFAAPEEALSPMQQPTTPITPLVAARLPAIPQDEPIVAPLPAPPLATPRVARARSNLSEHSYGGDPMQARRRAIKRQVKSLFVYPVAYLLFWIIPFVMHCMNYSDYYAVHPVFAISILASFCTTTLGLVDVIIFSWREKPWLHIGGSDGTLIGSFCFWRFERDLPFINRRRALTPPPKAPDEKAQQQSSSGLLHLVKRSWRRLSSSASPTYTSSDKGAARSRRSGGSGRGGPDSKVRAREQAQERLALEMQDHTAQAQAANDGGQVSAPQSPGLRNWFDDVSEIDIRTKTRRPTWTA